MDPFVGRRKELETLRGVAESGRPELVAVYGRRRVGKTRLIREFFGNPALLLEFTGARGAKTAEQLLNFSRVLAEGLAIEDKPATPSSWNDALEMLRQEIAKIKGKKRIVIFFDELPWLASPRSGFMPAFEYYWNRYFSRDERIIIVLCGSASSWMIRRVVDNRGGLYGRLTRVMRLLPLKLVEVEEFLHAHKIELDRRQIVELYMAVGGIPQYLQLIKRGVSIAGTINELFFQPSAPLSPEFDRIYRSLFDNHEAHVRIIRALANHPAGLDKTSLLRRADLSSGGSSTKMIQELQESGFITYVPQFGAKKTGGRYILIDEYSLFYITWVESIQKIGPESLDEDHWFKIQQSQQWKTWSGYAFECLCYKHLQEIKRALGISGVTTSSSGWSFRSPKGSQEIGAQIDLIIDRADRCINLIEIKFSTGPYTITKQYAKQLHHKKHLFMEKTKTKKTLFTTLLTTYGVKKNQHAVAVVDAELQMDALF